MEIKKLLVIGGTGFIGKAVCEKGITLGFTVISLSRNLPKYPLHNIKYLSCDITDFEKLQKTISYYKFNYIINCSGYIDHSSLDENGWRTIETHYFGLINLIRSIDKTSLERFIQIGSSDEYGSVVAPQNEKFREDPISPYSAAKVSSTYLLQMLWKTENFPSVVLRLFLVYGPGQEKSRFIPQIIDGCLSNKSFQVSKGLQTRDFCYIDDVVEGIYAALESTQVCGKIFNISSGIPVTIKSIIEKISIIIGQGLPNYGEIKYRVGENMDLWADITLSKKFLNWYPKTPFDVGILKTITYYRNER